MGEKDKTNEKQLCQLRINSKTIVLVPPEKCNEAYANKVRAILPLPRIVRRRAWFLSSS